MENYFATSFEDVGHEWSLLLLLSSLLDEGILKQTGFTGFDMNIIKNLALVKLHGQKTMKEHVALKILD